jgi:nucleoside-diphosphate kinase
MGMVGALHTRVDWASTFGGERKTRRVGGSLSTLRVIDLLTDLIRRKFCRQEVDGAFCNGAHCCGAFWCGAAARGRHWERAPRSGLSAPRPAPALPRETGLGISAANFSRQQEAKSDMALERTFSILKPDVTRRNLTGAVNARIEAAGLRIVAQKRVWMTRAQAETFYGVHRERPFFGELVEMMTAAPVVVQVLEGDNAIQRYRDTMGATNPEKAAAGTIRKDFALSMGENSVHGSDASATAAVEIAQFFSGNEIVG